MITKTLDLHNGDSIRKKDELIHYFTQTFEVYENLFECIKSERGFYEKANPLRHPLIFYYAHTAVFYINKLKVMKFISNGIDSNIETTMAIGVDEMSWDDLDEKNYDWPNIKEVYDYRQKVKKLLLDFIENTDLTLPISENSPFWIIMMGIEHERIHLETSSVLIRELPIEYLNKNSNWMKYASDIEAIPENKLIDIESKSFYQGINPFTYPYFYWDNERGQEKIELNHFKVSQYLVSNKEFLDFVEDDGYKKLNYWSDEGKSWLEFSNFKKPKFWIKKDKTYYLRVMLEEITLPWSWPVEVNYHEAKAFCAWKSQKMNEKLRLPLEAEYNLIRNELEANQPDWEVAPGNINLEYFTSPSPINSFESPNQVFDIIGNVWQWSEDCIFGFEGFRPHQAYDDFSLPTFDGKHALIKGGSWISTGNLALKDSRYAFRKHFYQHCGFRYVSSANSKIENFKEIIKEPFISRRCFDEYSDINKDFQNNLFSMIEKNLEKINKRKAMIVTSNGGKINLLLSNHFGCVDSLETTANNLKTLDSIKKFDSLEISIPAENKLNFFHQFSLKEIEYKSEKINLNQIDLSNINEKYKDYDFILLDNSLNHCNDISYFLNIIKSRLTSNSMIALITDYQFIDTLFAGFKSSEGESYNGKDAISDIFKKDFTLIDSKDLNYIEYINERKSNLIKKEVMFWIKI